MKNCKREFHSKQSITVETLKKSLIKRRIGDEVYKRRIETRTHTLPYIDYNGKAIESDRLLFSF